MIAPICLYYWGAQNEAMKSRITGVLRMELLSWIYSTIGLLLQFSLSWGIFVHNRQPEIRIVYTYMDAKNTIQPAVPIQPDFAQGAWTLLDPPHGQV